jgi:hypothetical protein
MLTPNSHLRHCHLRCVRLRLPVPLRLLPHLDLAEQGHRQPLPTDLKPPASRILEYLILRRMTVTNDAVFQRAKYEYNGNVSPREADGRDLLSANP